QVLFVHVAEGNDVLAGDGVEVGFAASPGANQCDVQLIARSIRAEEARSRQDKSSSPSQGCRFEELASFHINRDCGSLTRPRSTSKQKTQRDGIRMEA